MAVYVTSFEGWKIYVTKANSFYACKGKRYLTGFSFLAGVRQAILSLERKEQDDED